MNVRNQVLLGFFTLVVLSSSALLYLIFSDLKPRYRESVEESLVDFSFLMAGALDLERERGGDPAEFLSQVFKKAQSRELVAQIFSYEKHGIDMQGYLTDSNGILRFDSTGRNPPGTDFSMWRDVRFTLEGRYGARTSSDPDNPRSSVMYIAAPVSGPQGLAGVFSLGKPTRAIQELMNRVKQKLLWASAIIGVIAMAIAGLLSAFLTRPITRLTAYARGVAAGERKPLPALGRGEVATLGVAFESMREALEGKKYVEKYVETLTHEIKSPLSAIRGAAELLQEPMSREDQSRFVENIRGESVRLQLLVDRLLMLSSVEARRELRERKDIDIPPLLGRIVSTVGPRLSQHQLQVDLQCPSSVVIRGEEFLLEHAIRNLLENAIDFSPVGARIVVRLSTADGHVVISVEDSGPGIPDYAQQRVFDRFYSLHRPGSERKSTGLGLSLVKEVAELHGGSASIYNRASGGACAQISLPFTPNS